MTVPMSGPEYGDLVADVEFDVYGLRTFLVKDGQLASVAFGPGHWKDGVCVARCEAQGKNDEPHEVPGPAPCRCGVYACLSLDGLFRQYSQAASRIVAVIAAEGATAMGTVGFRTAVARIEAYWVADPVEFPDEARVLAAQCPEARRWYDCAVMARVYGLK